MRLHIYLHRQLRVRGIYRTLSFLPTCAQSNGRRLRVALACLLVTEHAIGGHRPDPIFHEIVDIFQFASAA